MSLPTEAALALLSAFKDSISDFNDRISSSTLRTFSIINLASIPLIARRAITSSGLFRSLGKVIILFTAKILKKDGFSIIELFFLLFRNP